MYKEFDKYKTGKMIPGKGIIINENNQEIDITLEEYNAPMGELIEDFIKHLNKPWWKRDGLHNHVTKQYKKMLNQITITGGF